MATPDLSLKLDMLTPFPAAACTLIRLIHNERVDFRDVSNVIAVDAAFSSQVLRLANSALVGARYEITSILQALSVVGVDRLRDIVVTVALKNFMGNTENAALRRCWRHNLATAFWCEKLASRFGIDVPLGYTAGILHDIGRIAMLMLVPGEYAALLEQPLPGTDDCLDRERRAWKTDHCQVGHSLAAAWNFPPVIRDVIAHHHDAVTQQSPRARRLAQAACAAATMSGFCVMAVTDPWTVEQMERMLPPGDSAGFDYEHLMESVAVKVNETECSLF